MFSASVILPEYKERALADFIDSLFVRRCNIHRLISLSRRYDAQHCIIKIFISVFGKLKLVSSLVSLLLLLVVLMVMSTLGHLCCEGHGHLSNASG